MTKSIISILITLLPISGFGQYPGGINTGLYLWLRGDLGVSVSGLNVTQWNNQASASMVTQASKNGTPNVTYNLNAFNYNPTLSFDGTTRQLLVGKYTTAPNAQPLLFAVVNKNGSSGGACCKDPYSLSPAGAPGIQFGGSPDSYYIDGAGFSATPSPPAVGIPAIVRVQYPTANNISGSSLGFNGTTYNTSSTYNSYPTNSPSGFFQVGGRTYDSLLGAVYLNRIYKGYLAEVLHYNTTLTTNSQINQIESYLALKYGITLSTSYASSSGQIVYAIDANYKNNIIGIGQDNNTALLQKQSHQNDDSTRIYLSSLSTSNSTNIGAFTSDDQYLVIGNNNGALKSMGSIVFPPSIRIYSRIDRQWKVTNTNFNGTFSLDIKLNTTPITPSDLRILITTDGNFYDATMYNPSISYSGGVVTISNLTTSLFPINSTVYFTIVSLSANTPLPTTLFNFSALYNRTNASVDLSLRVPSVLETDTEFLIIERSQDGENFSQLKTLEYQNAISTKDKSINYSYIDKKPLIGISYYRVKQTGINGGYKYYNTVSVDASLNQSINIYPNPLDNNEELIVNLIGYKNKELALTISDVIGRQVYNKKLTIDQNEAQLLIDDAKLLLAGTYICTISSTENFFSYRLIVK